MGELGFNLLASLARLFLEAIPKMSTINFWRENPNYFKNHCSSLRSQFLLSKIFDQFSKHCEELNLFFYYK